MADRKRIWIDVDDDMYKRISEREGGKFTTKSGYITYILHSYFSGNGGSDVSGMMKQMTDEISSLLEKNKDEIISKVTEIYSDELDPML